jgi:hypothetical protein
MSRVIILLALGLMGLANLPGGKVYGQSACEMYFGNASSRHWKELSSSHIRIVFPSAYRAKSAGLLGQAEHIYKEYKSRLGTAPEKITLYYLGNGELFSKSRAFDAIKADNIWAGNPSRTGVLHLKSLTGALRYEIAAAFQDHIQSIIIQYWHFIAYPPPDFPWQDGLISYLVRPQKVAGEENTLGHYWFMEKRHSNLSRLAADTLNIWIGRSQIQYFTRTGGSLQDIYTWRDTLLGLFHYFNFQPAFKQAADISYPAFEKQWKVHEKQRIKADKSKGNQFNPGKKPGASSVTFHSIVQDSAAHFSDLPIKPYHPLFHTQLKTPIILPYYASPDNYGIGTLLQFKEPMGTHALNITGLFSAAHPVHKSYFTAKYINNTFKPRLALRFNHFSSGTLILGRFRKARLNSVLAASSLWKLSGPKPRVGRWYFGLRLRYIAISYFPTKLLHHKYPHLFFENEKTHQTDLKAVLTWKKLKPGPNTFINPAKGSGVQLAVTGSEKILGSNVQYARLNMSGYTILPAYHKQRIFVYADGVMDIGSPAGRDYLAFSKGGQYELPGPNFLGELNPSHRDFIRGYNTPLTGSRFVFGRLEYRIPFEFNTTRKLFGVIPPARTVFAFFTDGGVMGDARIAPNVVKTRYRWSAGFEIKRVITAPGNVQLAYELGIGQPLTKSFGPHPYIRVQMAIPF